MCFLVACCYNLYKLTKHEIVLFIKLLTNILANTNKMSAVLKRLICVFEASELIGLLVENQSTDQCRKTQVDLYVYFFIDVENF